MSHTTAARAGGRVEGRLVWCAQGGVRGIALARAIFDVEVRSFLWTFLLMVALVEASGLVEFLVLGEINVNQVLHAFASAIVLVEVRSERRAGASFFDAIAGASALVEVRFVSRARHLAFFAFALASAGVEVRS